MSAESSVSESKLVSNAILNKDIDTLKELADGSNRAISILKDNDEFDDRWLDATKEILKNSINLLNNEQNYIAGFIAIKIVKLDYKVIDDISGYRRHASSNLNIEHTDFPITFQVDTEYHGARYERTICRCAGVIIFEYSTWSGQKSNFVHSSSVLKGRSIIEASIIEANTKLNPSDIEDLIYSNRYLYQIKFNKLYDKLSELVAEDARLTKAVNSKKETLNSLIEDIGAKKRQLEQLDLKLINVHNELDAATSYFKQYQIANEIKYELSFEQLSSEEKHLLECKHLHEYYIQFANDLKVYKFAFEHMRELSSKLENERQEIEKMKANLNSELEAKMKAREQELEKKQAQFDAECEAYELESTKWKSKQESKFAKFQERIDNYEPIKESRDALRKENDKLRAQLKSMTAERDKYKTTVETMMQFRK